MNYEEIKIIIFNISILSALTYSLIMAIYTYRDGYKKLPVLFAVLSVVAILVITGNIQIIWDVMFTLYTNKIIAIITTISALFFVIAFYLMFFYYEKTSILFFSIAISMFIVSVLIL